MKLLKLTIGIITLLLVAVACGNSSKADYSVKRAELMHVYNEYLMHKPLPAHSKIDSLQLYFEKYGTDEERLLCRYCRGASLLEDRCLKSAYMEFYKVYEERPSRFTPLSREVMRGTLSHLLRMCVRDCNFEKAKYWWSVADSLNVYSEVNKYGLLYDKAMLMAADQQEDSCWYYLTKAMENIRHNSSWDENKSVGLMEIAAYYAKAGKTAEFKQAYELLQLHPYHGNDINLDLCLGLFYAQQGRRDSANSYFHKALNASPQSALDAVIQLGISARNRQEHDTVFFYFQKCVDLYESILEEQGNSYSRDVEALYETHEKEQKIAEQRIALLRLEVAFLVALLLVVVSAWLVFVYRKHLMKTRRQLDMEQKRREDIERRLQEVLDEMEHKQIALVEESVKRDFETMLQELACMADAKQSVSTELLTEFIGLLATLHPEACERMKSKYPRIKSTDYVICALAKYNFKQSQIAKLLDRENAEIYHFMLRISKGLTGEAIGRMTDFKVMLEERIFVEDKQ